MPFNLDSFVQGANKLGGSIGGNAGNAIRSVAGIAQGVGNIGKIFSKTGLPKGGQPTTGNTTATAGFKEIGARDWRVSLSIPFGSYYTSKILQPLVKNGKFIFPYTPQITLSHSANYSAMEPVHNNYSFAAYENSKLDKIQISGDFYCENSDDASYWIASVHFLRSVSKMYFGASTENSGAPPPVIKLNGYGDFVFNNIPVVVSQFSVELPKDVDYIPSQFVGTSIIQGKDFDQAGVGYVPVKSTISVTLLPVYSRESVRNFNLQDFVKGAYIDKGFV